MRNNALLRVSAVAITAVMCTLVVLSAVFPFPASVSNLGFLSSSITPAQGQEPELGELVNQRDCTSKVYYLGNNQYALDSYIGAIHYEDEYGAWQDIDTTYEEADTGDYSVKFTKLYYLGRIGDDSRRRLYPDRNNLDCWIEFQKPFETMPTPSRQDGWFYWNFAHALMGIRFDPTSVKFGFRLKDSEAPTSITIPFTTQGLTRDGRFLYHNEECVGELKRPWAIDANNVTRDCGISFGGGSVTVSLNVTDLVYPIDIDPTLDLQVSVGNDDAYELKSTGVIDRTGNYVYWQGGRWGAHRWTSAGFPVQGDTITVAYLTLYSSNDDDVNGYIHFEKAGAPSEFSTSNYDISGRDRTTAKVTWIASNLGGYAWHNTPSLVTPLQEVIDSYSPTAIVSLFDGQDVQLVVMAEEYSSGQYAAKLHIEWTSGCSPSISLNTYSWNVNSGNLVSESSNYATGLTYFTITNNSGGAVTITIGGADMTGGGYTWDLSDDGSVGDMIYGMKAGLSGGDYTIVVKETAPYNTLKAGLADSGTQDFGLKIYTPTNFDDGNDKSGAITLTTACD